jgi:peptide/nickel transport system substrate-binding protein
MDPYDGSLVPPARRYGGTAVVGGSKDISTLNSLVSTDVVAREHQNYILFTTLIRLDDQLGAQPYLAKSWEISPDSTLITFRLRDDVFWHDGRPTTARDVAFTFEAAKNPEIPFPNRADFDLWEEVEVLDDYTIRFVLRPHAGFLYGWSQLAIMPAHILAAVPPEELATHPFGTTKPVGNGPFRFLERLPGDRWVFEANDDFPPELGGRPYLDRLVYRVIPEDATLLAELKTGGIEMYPNMPPGLAARAESDPSIDILQAATSGYAFIAWNSKRPFFRSPELRRAITMAIDRQALVDAAREGLGSVATGPVGPWHWAYDSSWSALPFTPDSAGTLLDAAGWIDRNGDGIRDRNGLPFRFEILTNESSVRRDMAVMVQSNLAAVGIDAQPRSREPGSLAAAVTSPERRYDAVLIVWVRDVGKIDDRDLWSCDRIGNPWQFTSYCNPELDPILDSIPITMDRERRGELIRRYHEVIAADQPYTFLYNEIRTAGVRRSLKGVEIDIRGDWVSVIDWWVLPAFRDR